jgi:hypothetical protein
MQQAAVVRVPATGGAQSREGMGTSQVRTRVFTTDRLTARPQHEHDRAGP